MDKILSTNIVNFLCVVLDKLNNIYGLDKPKPKDMQQTVSSPNASTAPPNLE